MPTCVHRIEFRGKLAQRVQKNPVCFQPGVNLLIGPNGSGKSTICRSISKKPHSPDVSFEVSSGKILFFDFERDNPRLKHWVDSAADIAVRMMSHGQVVRELIKKLADAEDIKDQAIIIDEPEAALDIDGIEGLIQALKTSVAHQIIVATHCPFLILRPEFHCVELVEGFREHVKTQVRKLAQIEP